MLITKKAYAEFDEKTVFSYIALSKLYLYIYVYTVIGSDSSHTNIHNYMLRNIYSLLQQYLYKYILYYIVYNIDNV